MNIKVTKFKSFTEVTMKVKRSCRRTSQYCAIKCKMKFNKEKCEVMPGKK